MTATPEFVSEPARRCARRRARPTSSWWAAARPASRRRSPAARNGAQRHACSSAIPISAAWPRAAWCWCSTTCATASEISVRGLCVDHDRAHGAARASRCTPPEADRALRTQRCGASGRAGACSTSTAHRSRSRSSIAAAFDPDGCKRVSQRDGRGGQASSCACTLVLAAPSSRTARIKGVVCETKAGRQAILGDVVDRRHRRPRRRRLGRRAVHRAAPTS